MSLGVSACIDQYSSRKYQERSTTRKMWQVIFGKKITETITYQFKPSDMGVDRWPYRNDKISRLYVRGRPLRAPLAMKGDEPVMEMP